MRVLQALWRTLCVLAHLLRAAWILQRGFANWPLAERQVVVQQWSQRMLQLMGVTLHMEGQPPLGGPALVLANHISWLDILVINAAWPCRFVSKSDVKRWPGLGRLIEGAGTLFIERDKRRDALRVVHQLAERLQAGDVLAVFPEGTTGDGSTLLPFHANLLQAAVSTATPVLPLGLRYCHAYTGLRHEAPVYIGDTTLVASLWRTLCAGDLQAEVCWMSLDTAQGRDRRTWADAIRSNLAHRLGLPLSD